ncbi:MAG: acetyl-CoA decarbonylase/synthase complex subunit beta 1, partial [Methanococci archaeon]|nr:acetyl-CoA decarbonylase/synthase complex subunit beta 1 [Methanococci archaeon]
PEGLFDKIATEEEVKTTDELIKFLKEKGHPVFKKEEVEEEKEEKEEEKSAKVEKRSVDDEDSFEVGELIAKLAKDGGVQIIMKNVKITINLNMRR